ncbi:DMT family transporter [Hyphococcus aureus]|uniref:DMT family transporter n=1 Tax=Hyphococcus aureus TaxID=2666033 RepID=A0ABW1KQS6_9PROT
MVSPLSVREISILLLICVIWGFHFVVIKTAVGVMPPIFYAAIRMVLVAAILSRFLTWRKGEMRFVLIGGVCIGALNYALMFTGMKFATASAAAIAIELNVPFSTMLAFLFLNDRPGLPRILGIAFAFAGVAVIALGGDGGGGEHVGLGVGLVAAGAFSEAVGAVIVKRTTAFKPHELLAWFSLVGAVILSGMTLVFEDGQLDALQHSDKLFLVGAILYSALGASLFGHTAYYWLLQRLPISVVAPSVLLTTVCAVFFGVLLMGDPFGVRMMVGGFMTLCGVGLVLLRNVKKQAKNDALVQPQGEGA